MKSKILSLHEQFVRNPKTINDNLLASKKIYDKITNLNASITSNYVDAKESKSADKNNLLYGINYSLKDNISTKDILTTGGSSFLKEYCPPFNATVYKTLQDKGAILISKDNMDEFGLGATGTFSAYGEVKSFVDPLHNPGGSSSGSAVMVSSGASVFAIATDTGDSIRRPASLNGVVGYKPTYGLISRYGVYPYAPSMDHVGVIASNVIDAMIVANEIIRFDQKDFSSQNKKIDLDYKNLTSKKSVNFVVIKDLVEKLPEKYLSQFKKLIEQIRNQGHKVICKEIEPSQIELIKTISVVYQILSYAEAYSCYANMTGISFGQSLKEDNDTYEQIITKNRSAFFGKELKRRFIIGAYLTRKENYKDVYLKAKQIRKLFNDLLLNILNMGDCLLMPATSCIVSEVKQTKINNFETNLIDDLLILSNFAGTPSITISLCNIDNMPWGINLTCNVFEDKQLFDIAYMLEQLIVNPKGGKNE